MAAERGRVMSGGGGRTRPRYVGRHCPTVWWPRRAFPPVARPSRACRSPVARLSPACRAPVAEKGIPACRAPFARPSRACCLPILGLGLNKNSDWDKIRTSNNIRYFHSCRFRHPNLVSLMGFHKSNTKTALVYEYMHGGSLYSHLHDVRTYIEYFLCTKIVCIIGNC